MTERYNQSGFITTSDIPETNLKSTASTIKTAAVLIPLLKQNDQWEILYIRRSEREGDHHSGQVAFPGGRAEQADVNTEATAIRETWEEVGIENKDVSVIGRLQSYRTISAYEIHPFVATISWPIPLTQQETEVARIFTIPLNWLRDNNNYELRQHLNPSIASQHNSQVVYYKPYKGEILWGATARITLTLLKAMDEGSINLHQA